MLPVLAIIDYHSLCTTLKIYTRLAVFATTSFSETLAPIRLSPDFTVPV